MFLLGAEVRRNGLLGMVCQLAVYQNCELLGYDILWNVERTTKYNSNATYSEGCQEWLLYRLMSHARSDSCRRMWTAVARRKGLQTTSHCSTWSTVCVCNVFVSWTCKCFVGWQSCRPIVKCSLHLCCRRAHRPSQPTAFEHARECLTCQTLQCSFATARDYHHRLPVPKTARAVSFGKKAVRCASCWINCPWYRAHPHRNKCRSALMIALFCAKVAAFFCAKVATFFCGWWHHVGRAPHSPSLQPDITAKASQRGPRIWDRGSSLSYQGISAERSLWHTMYIQTLTLDSRDNSFKLLFSRSSLPKSLYLSTYLPS